MHLRLAKNLTKN